MNPRQKMNEKEIHNYNMRLIQHNFDKFEKLEDFSMFWNVFKVLFDYHRVHSFGLLLNIWIIL